MSNVQSSRLFAGIILVCLAAPVIGADVLEEIIVTADLRGRSTLELPTSVTLLDDQQVRQLANQHFEELINVIPNLNWSGDGHRARYFQIRGVGELEQYQGAPNPSVGFLVDDIDLSGIGTVATLFDMERIEVLRGPQGSRYGANALGGLIYMRSTMPGSERNGRLQLSAGGDDAFSAGIAFGGAFDDADRALFRLSAQHYQSNGFRDNPYLSRNDTNDRDETTIRARMNFAVSETFAVNIAAFVSEVDNGYDAFAIDNSYTVLSDKPGKDAQDSFGTSLRLEWFALPVGTLTSISAIADSDIEFSFDADWGNDDAWSPILYDFISANDRKRRTLSQEFRLASTAGGQSSWLLGLYALRLEDDLQTLNQGEYFDPGISFADSVNDSFGSEYEATNLALFGQYERAVTDATRLSFGLRIERRTTDYSDSLALTTSPSDSMAGGELGISHDHTDGLTSYVTVSRGYKAGGFNIGLVPPDKRQFGKEALWNFEAGIKSLQAGGKLALNVSLFHNIREDQQVRSSFQLDPNNPASFGFITQNVPRGSATGLELDVRWLAGDSLELYANLGLIETELGGFDREQAHAPRYTFAAGGHYRHVSGWFARLDVSAKDDFFFDVSHDEKSQSYALANARIGYEADSWTAHLWVRNLFDEDYAVRGFFFGNEPPNFAPTLYTRFGDPRQAGISLEKRFGS
jgi:outer membrane receptor protein involved in Fe transport